MNATQSSLQLPTSLHTSLNLPAGFHLCRSCGHASDSPTSNVREAPGLAWSRQLVWSCQCLHLQTRCACSSSSFQPFHITTPPLYTNSLSLSLSISFSDFPSRPPRFSPTSHHSVRRVLPYTAPHRTAPHRTPHYYHSTPHYHPSLYTHHSPPTKHVLPPTWTFPFVHPRHPPIHPLLHYANARSIAAQSRRVCRGVTTAYKREHSLYRHTTHTYKSTTDEMTSVDIDFTRRNKKPRLLTDSERDKLDEFIDAIHYSSR